MSTSSDTDETIDVEYVTDSESCPDPLACVVEGPSRKRPRLDVDGAAGEFGGYSGVVSQVRRVMSHVQHARVYLSLGLDPPRGFLIHGPRGSGKSLLARSVAAQLNLPIYTLTQHDLVCYSAVSKIQYTFQAAATAIPAVVLIDGLENVAERKDVQKIIASLMDKLEPGILVVGTVNSLEEIPSSLRTTGRLDKEFGIGVPGLDDRTSILNVLTANIKLESGLEMKDIATLTPGFLGGDLKFLISEAGMEAVDKALSAEDATSRTSEEISNETLAKVFIRKEDFIIALKRVQPSMKREWYVKVPEITWDDVGSLKNVRQQLEMSIILPVVHHDEFNKLGITRPTGILLCGPPGCGKTLIAKAVANEAQLNFLSVKGPELLSMYVGESERGVRQCFQRAKACRPCIIFMDEIDSLCPRRYGSGDVSNITARVVNQVLTEMDGVEDRCGVFLLAATNRPDVLDPALLRPGRFDKIVWVGLPSPEDRLDILRALTRKIPLNDVNLEELAKNPRLNGYSGADLSALVKEACVIALTRHLNDKSVELHVTMDIFQEVASKLSPSVKDLSFYRRIKQSISEKKEKEHSGHVGIFS